MSSDASAVPLFGSTEHNGRPCFFFRVPVEAFHPARSTRYLAATGRLVETPEEAATFTFHAGMTGLDRVRVRQRQHTVLGGLRDFAELRQAVDNMGESLRRRVAAQVWPGGRPQTEDPKVRQAQEDLFQAAWTAATANPDVEMTGLQEMSTLLSKVRFLAEWEVLAVDVPNGWRDLAARELADESLWASIERAWHEARAEHAEGNARPSAS